MPGHNNEELEQLLNSISSLQVKLAQLLNEEIDLMIRKLQATRYRTVKFYIPL